MRTIRRRIPKVFQACILTSLGVLVVVCVVSHLIGGIYFAAQVAIAGGIGVALLAQYMLWVSRTVSRAKSLMASDETGETASRVATRIQIASLVKFFATTGLLVVLVVVFRFKPVAIVVGIAGLYVPYAFIPLLFKPEEAEMTLTEGASEVTEDRDK